MSSQRYLTYDIALELFGDDHRVTELPWRPNTTLHYNDNGRRNPPTISMKLYGWTIATLYPDDTVHISNQGVWSNTTKNRLNDVLLPLGRKLRQIDGRWFITGEGEYSREFIRHAYVTRNKTNN